MVSVGNPGTVIEVWDHRGNRQSIDRQETEIDQISKAVYAASELLLDKDGTVNMISELHNLFQYIKVPPVGLGISSIKSNLNFNENLSFRLY